MDDAKPCEGVHKRSAPTVRAETSYSLVGHLLLFYGITAEPRAVRFRCELCQRVIGESTDRAVRRAHVAR